MSRFKLPGASRRRSPQPPPAPVIATERVPLLAETLQRTQQRPRRIVLDLAPAASASMALYNELSCRLQLADFPSLRNQLARATNPQQFQTMLDAGLPQDPRHPANLVLCWDYLNYLPRGPISLLMQHIAQQAQPGALVHMLIAYSTPQMPAAPCLFTPDGRDHVRVQPVSESQREAPRYAPNDLMRCMPDYKIDKAMLLRNGYQEYILQVRDHDAEAATPSPPEPQPAATSRR